MSKIFKGRKPGKLTFKLQQELAGIVQQARQQAAQEAGMWGITTTLRIARAWFGADIPVEVVDACVKAVQNNKELNTIAAVDAEFERIVQRDKVNLQLTKQLLSNMESAEKKDTDDGA